MDPNFQKPVFLMFFLLNSAHVCLVNVVPRIIIDSGIGWVSRLSEVVLPERPSETHRWQLVMAFVTVDPSLRTVVECMRLGLACEHPVSVGVSLPEEGPFKYEGCYILLLHGVI